MATVTRSKAYPDVSNTENWKYTTTNNIKRFNNKDDVKRFILGTSKIWKLDNVKNGQAFTDSLLQSIDVMHESNTAGLEYVDDKGDVCYILFLIEVSPDRKSMQITHTQHKLSRSGARKNATDNVQVEECNAGRWLMQRAYDELHLPQHTMEAMMFNNHNSLEHRTPKYSSEERSISLEGINQIFEAARSNFQSENYCEAHRKRFGKTFLRSILEISSFCERISESDAFLEHLVDQIQNVQQPKEFLHHLQYLDGEKWTLAIMVKPDRAYIRMVTEMRHDTTRSQK
ncbi:unnamed protein product [Rotaria sp. Silwood2]|nr:unnamed protein product [Rotaria sp. Silwood2]CAF2953532.1 unnamed protein product [Rotaria sp. Silwood2]CAF3381158.1 unnamed protein product [Rotaria sp. Silwood2]CAF3937145.1 unnamed protein product [Rotaria sp. Silwood2]CAF4339795.1 unnamed protein product [Rotaria sp. Silwood2]